MFAFRYERAWLRSDVTAGLVLTALLVPQGVAYAELAGLPAITGLYTTILCLLAYAVFGPSRILVLGPDSSLGPMIAATIMPLLVARGERRLVVAVACAQAFCGQLGMIRARLTVACPRATRLSKPTMIGYMNCLA